MRFGCYVWTAVLLSLCAPVRAQLKPDMLIVLDNSVSMRDNIPGATVANPCGYGTTGARTLSKAAAALCAMHNMVTSTGDAEFGLMTFANSTSTCTTDKTSGRMDIPLQTNNAAILAARFDTIGTGNLDSYFSATTPTGGALAAAKAYFEGTFQSYDSPTLYDAKAACRSLNVVLVTDGMEQCAGGCPAVGTYYDLTYANACPKALADTSRPELQQLVCTPGCNANNFNMAQERAWELYAETMADSPSGAIPKTVRTYVVGFGVDPLGVGIERIESIALAGGTDNPDPNYRAFYPQNQSELAIALSQIIADAQPPDEICNGDDDDCDGKIDEGIPLYCDLANNHPTADLCMSPGETNCDGLDDDCDGIIDEGVLNVCGGCGPIPDETCDAVDNDCDGRVDESTDSGDKCGSDVGICRAGKVVCISGALSCEGSLGPGVETCDCSDNDCDGNIDEDVDGSLCGGDSVCVGCECAPPCKASEEFVAICGRGLVASFLPNGACVCVVDNCDPAQCKNDTLKRDGEVACAPHDKSLAPCLCEGGSCVAPCDGISCARTEVCDPHLRRCVLNDCRGLGCAKGEVCDTNSGQCQPDPCATLECDAHQTCEDGKCVDAPPSKDESSDGGPGGVDNVESPEKSNAYVFATGGAACGCQIVGAATPATNRLSVWMLLAFVGLVIARRNRKPQSLGDILVALLALLLLAGGCKVRPYCVTCVDAEVVDAEPEAKPDPVKGFDAGDTPSRDASLYHPDASVADSGPSCIPVAETCNNMDDDCDFRVDEDVRPKDNNCSQVGVCAGTTPACVSGKFECPFSGAYEVDEKTCDNLDNDCDGLVDETFPDLHKSCEVGIGSCKATGKLVCAATGIDVQCNAVADSASPEVCDNVDNDCDGLIDEPRDAPGSDPSYVVDEMVKVGDGLWIYKYEASRPDATNASNGNLNSRPCSRKGVLPWTNITYDEALASCQAIGMDLCTASDWLDACDGDGSCLWSYTPNTTNVCVDNASASEAGDVWQGCNGHDVNATQGNIGDPNNPDDDVILPTGKKSQCFSEIPDGKVFDLSGNAKEWVNDDSYDGDARALRGGSYNDLASALRCDYDLAAANHDIRLPTIGFRCCSTSAP